MKVLHRDAARAARPAHLDHGVERGERHAMSEGCAAMQCSLAPTIACMRLRPSSAAQPEPGLRLLHASNAVSQK